MKSLLSFLQQLDEERKQLMKSHAEKLERIEADRKRREELDRKQLVTQVGCRKTRAFTSLRRYSKCRSAIEDLARGSRRPSVTAARGRRPAPAALAFPAQRSSEKCFSQKVSRADAHCPCALFLHHSVVKEKTELLFCLSREASSRGKFIIATRKLVA